ncbi:hypothetical protein [Christiangramia portivictoriae]|uniref:hypothetical protein n=1 Tax=Christiangramia portivictoriae TaxID=326069 RepID=UPI0003F716AC|nr:hypothetical protein [Christiangramia portivictoriae]
MSKKPTNRRFTWSEIKKDLEQIMNKDPDIEIIKLSIQVKKYKGDNPKTALLVYKK